MSAVDDTPPIIAYRVKRNEQKLEKLDEWKVIVDDERSTMREQLKGVRDDIVEVKSAVDGLKKVLIGFAISVALASVTTVFTVLAATGRLSHG